MLAQPRRRSLQKLRQQRQWSVWLRHCHVGARLCWLQRRWPCAQVAWRRDHHAHHHECAQTHAFQKRAPPVQDSPLDRNNRNNPNLVDAQLPAAALPRCSRAAMAAPTDSISAINEVKQWLS